MIRAFGSRKCRSEFGQLFRVVSVVGWLSWRALSSDFPLDGAGNIYKSHEPTEKCKKFTISHIDHLVLTVENIDATVKFYTQVLGMDKVTFGHGRTALAFGSQKLNLHEKGKEFEPKAANPTPGAVDICFITDTPIQSIRGYLKSLDITVEEGPVQRTGATGPITSVYFRDPDNNLIEISKYNSDS